MKRPIINDSNEINAFTGGQIIQQSYFITNKEIAR